MIISLHAFSNCYRRNLSYFFNDSNPGSNRMNEKTATATFAAGCFWGPRRVSARWTACSMPKWATPAARSKIPTIVRYAPVAPGTPKPFADLRSRKDQLRGRCWTRSGRCTIRPSESAGRRTWVRSTAARSSPTTTSSTRRPSARSANWRLRGVSGPVVTEIRPAGRFWRAEEYHQRYLGKARARVLIG